MTEFPRKELLDKCWDDQRSEIIHRRDREHTIFQFAATVWLAVSSFLVVNSRKEDFFLQSADWWQRCSLTLLVILAAVVTHRWLQKQRRARAESEEALADIQTEAGCYEEDAK